MTLYQAEYRSRVRRERAKEAIALAMENSWEEAAAINRSIIELFPDDVEAHNRLGKALFEIGKFEEARSAFAKASQLSPSNAIAQKNLERLSLLKKEHQPLKKAPKLGPEHFLEESGKTGTAVLEHPASREVVAKVTAGDALALRTVDNKLVAETTDGEYLGQVPPRLAARLIRLVPPSFIDTLFFPNPSLSQRCRLFAKRRSNLEYSFLADLHGARFRVAGLRDITSPRA